MGRRGLTYSELKQACDEMHANAETITYETLGLRLRGASNSTIGPLLKKWRAEFSEKPPSILGLILPVTIVSEITGWAEREVLTREAAFIESYNKQNELRETYESSLEELEAHRKSDLDTVLNLTTENDKLRGKNEQLSQELISGNEKLFSTLQRLAVAETTIVFTQEKLSTSQASQSQMEFRLTALETNLENARTWERTANETTMRLEHQKEASEQLRDNFLERSLERDEINKSQEQKILALELKLDASEKHLFEAEKLLAISQYRAS